MIRNFLALAGALVLLATFTPLVHWVAATLSDPWGREDQPVLVVLGGSMLIPGTGPNATLGEDTYLRCVVAAALAKEHDYRYIVVTGSEGLAEEMQRFLVFRGVDPSRILEENAATSTRENALFTRRLLLQHFTQLPPVAVLTSDYHSRRARLTFQRAGFAAVSIPAPDILKRSSSLSYRIQGTLTIALELAKLTSYKLKGYA